MSGGGYMEVDSWKPSRQCGAVFIDQHTDTLIQRACTVEPILDKLLSLNIINNEEYQNIRAETTPQKQMRELLMGPMRSRGDSAKQALYNTLKEQQLHMMEDLGAA
ncbi:hypothetical protein KOW79_019104 [Hemibagrus wyckioides]|uniref:CARD domain-containing protein n=1 Tax=Hemibagrus wyckioides TaxID=337641 RepID=A0A9D3N8X5_9TELE|nr:apoptosis-associated speck-like protein containing a CARD [Hemibagrus wyckioides]KAG7318069.1 hypothetical protein KOW79_019104 [Hemibagrus wyckioides]